MAAFDIRQALNQIQYEIMNEWEQKTRLRIGVSIQLFDQVQDNYSQTRTEPVNDFCKRIVSNKIQLNLCNLLDLNLKQVVVDTNNLKGIACKCHKNVSNIMTPFRFKEIVWYIFYGQFLFVLSKHPNDLRNVTFLYEKILRRRFDEEGIISNLNSKNKNRYYKPNCIVDIESDRNFSDSDISQVDIIDFFQFKSYVETKFNLFLDGIYSDPVKQKLLQEFIKKVTPAERIKLIVARIEDLFRSFESNKRFEDINQKNMVLDLISILTSNIYKFNGNAVQQFDKLLNDGESTGNIFSNKWINEGTKLVNEYL
jgi:hypothetical protein